MTSKIVERIQAQSDMPRLFDLLADNLPLSDLQSLLLEVCRRRARRQTPSGVLTRAARGGLVAPSDVDARLLHRVERCAFEAAVGFDAVELAPVLPFGCHAAMGGIDQNNVLTTIRNADVTGDPSTALAIEAALRRRGAGQSPGDHTPVRLCASQRAVRMQPFDVPGFSPHFKLFCLLSAGRDTGENEFEFGQLRLHLCFYLRFFRLLNRCGFQMVKPLIEVTDHRLTAALLERAGITPEEVRQSIRAHQLGGSERLLRDRGVELPDQPGERLEMVQSRVFEPLQREFPEAAFRLLISRLEGFGYYQGFCLRVSPIATDGRRYPIADGGFVDWTARLLANRKERTLSSGIGIEFICRRYRGTSDDGPGE
jgi:hypothetical protein